LKAIQREEEMMKAIDRGVGSMRGIVCRSPGAFDRLTLEEIEKPAVPADGVLVRAGIILAGTFCVLTTVPVRDGVETGLAVALGILLDTFIVRSLLVPGITMLIGRHAWWPSKLPMHDELGDDGPALNRGQAVLAPRLEGA
jgi:hypothetical protein